MENKSRSWTRWLFWFSLIVSVVVVYKTLDNIGDIVGGIGRFLGVISAFLIGILIAYILYVPCRKFEELYSKVKKVKFIKNKARPLSILTVYIIVILLIAVLINVILPPVTQSIIDLVNNSTSYYNTAVTKINELPEDSILKTRPAQEVIENIKSVDLTKIINTDKLTDYAQTIIGMLRRNI